MSFSKTKQVPSVLETVHDKLNASIKLFCQVNKFRVEDVSAKSDKRFSLLMAFKLLYKSQFPKLTVISLLDLKIKLFETYLQSHDEVIHSLPKHSTIRDIAVQRHRLYSNLSDYNLVLYLLLCYLHNGDYENELQFILIKLLVIAFRCSIDFYLANYDELRTRYCFTHVYSCCTPLPIIRFKDATYRVFIDQAVCRVNAVDLNQNENFRFFEWLNAESHYTNHIVAVCFKNVRQVCTLSPQIDRVRVRSSVLSGLLQIYQSHDLQALSLENLTPQKNSDYLASDENSYEDKLIGGLECLSYETIGLELKELLNSNDDLKNYLKKLLRLCSSEFLYKKMNLIFVGKDPVQIALFQIPPAVILVDAILSNSYFLVYWSNDHRSYRFIVMENDDEFADVLDDLSKHVFIYMENEQYKKEVDRIRMDCHADCIKNECEPQQQFARSLNKSIIAIVLTSVIAVVLYFFINS